jgi:hypothetical protein
MRLGVGFSLSAVHYLHARYVVGCLNGLLHGHRL